MFSNPSVPSRFTLPSVPHPRFTLPNIPPPPRSPCRPDTPYRTLYCRPIPPPPRRQPVNDNAFTPTQSKLPQFKGLMFPRHEVLDHPAGPDLLEYALEGCPVDCGDDWTLEHLKLAIANGAHASANVPKAAAACKKEALERVTEGSCRLVNWEDIKHDFPPKSKNFTTSCSTAQVSRLLDYPRLILPAPRQRKEAGLSKQCVRQIFGKTRINVQTRERYPQNHMGNGSVERQNDTFYVLKSGFEGWLLANGSQQKRCMEFTRAVRTKLLRPMQGYSFSSELRYSGLISFIY